MRATLAVHDLASGRSHVVLHSPTLIEAPNWHPDGWLLVNGDGRLYRVDLKDPRLDPIPMALDARCNNDHGFTRDGQWILFSAHRGHGAEIFRMPVTGGAADLISPAAPSWFHGLSPDGQVMTYPAVRGDTRILDIYSKPFDGPERRLTQGQGHADGPEFSADGTQIYYNCDRSGHAQIWVMQADGRDQRQLFADDHVNWFPHPSPDGAHVLYLAYPPGTLEHPRDLPVALCLMNPDGTNRRAVLHITGGQGSINGPCWSPDGKAFAYVHYASEP